MVNGPQSNPPDRAGEAPGPDHRPQAAHHETAKAIGRATAVIVAIGLLDKVLAVGKEILMAARFGVDSQVDAFNIAYAFPGIVNLLFNGACVAAFVPLYAAWKNDSDKNLARDGALTALAAAALFFVLAAWATSAFAPFILRVIGYGFSSQTLDLAVDMERSLAWLVALEGAGVVCAALLQSFKRFGVLTLTQTLINLSIIVFLLAGKSLGIDALIDGFLVGTALKVAAMFACMGGCGLSSLKGFRPRPQALKGFALLAWPLLGSALIANSNILIDQSMTTVLPAGAVAVLRYAYRVNDLPLQVVVLAVSRAIFPFISEQAAGNDRAGMNKVFRLSLVFIALVCAPITCYVLVFADDIVTVLLLRGAFDAQAAAQTALTLRCYAVGLFFHAYTFINGAFYSALRRGSVLMRLGLLSLTLNFCFNWLFLRLLHGPEAIALSTTATMGIISCIFYSILRKYLGADLSSGMGRAFFVVTAATGSASAVCWPLRAWTASLEINVWLALPGLSVVFLAMYGCVVLALKSVEVEGVVRLCLPRFKT